MTELIDVVEYLVDNWCTMEYEFRFDYAKCKFLKEWVQQLRDYDSLHRTNKEGEE